MGKSREKQDAAERSIRQRVPPRIPDKEKSANETGEIRRKKIVDRPLFAAFRFFFEKFGVAEKAFREVERCVFYLELIL